MKFSTAAAAATVFASTALAADLPAIVIKGSKFFYSNNGTQFFMRGVAYQQGVGAGGSSDTSGSGTNEYTDPLADASQCQRDIPYLVALRTNIIRTYAIDPTKDHSDCMSQLADAGIYVVTDLSEPGTSINRDSPSWNDELYSRYTAVIDNMQQYTNVLGFFAGNEVSNAANNTDASAFVKAAVRDSKAYIKSKGYRTIPVGYATNDDADIRVNMADYFNCGNQTDAIDFWGYNIYSWCGDSSYTESGYNVRTEEFSTYSVPAFFAEYGCNAVQPRTFTEVAALYGDEMSPVWSGGIVYMYFQEANDYGLVTVNGNSVSTLADFNYLSKELASVNPSGVNSDSYTPTNSPQSCPATGTTWLAAATPLPPTPNEELCSCMVASLGCVVASDVDTDGYSTMFSYICGADPSACDGIARNATTGTYGAYSMCNSTEQLNWVLNAYYKDQDSSSQACDFNGNATVVSSSSASGTCSALLNQAGASGTGTVTSSPNSSGGSSSGSSGSSSSSKAAAAGLTVPQAHLGFVSLGAYVVAVGVVGMSMVLL